MDFEKLNQFLLEFPAETFLSKHADARVFKVLSSRNEIDELVRKEKFSLLYADECAFSCG